jgi:hypothetical protein
LFPFGETLAKQSRFAAGEAMGWGEGYEWPRIQGLLQQLIEQGILVHAADVEREPDVLADKIRESPLPLSICKAARSWDECEAITRDRAGRPVELGHLELIVPVFRVAHIAVDADQRQVGEANVFPPSLRLNVPTEWRTCNLPGTRYQSHRPMNMTAMRVMRAHWSQMMASVLRVREEYLRRFPEANGAWTIGHIERLSVAVLALPSYQLMRRTDRVENGNLHPALSSLFRVTDGVRMVMHQMLFMSSNEPSRSAHQVVTTDEILDYAERNYSFHSPHGVCAGPTAMVRELIEVLLNGHGNVDYASFVLEPAVQAACNDVRFAVDYALLGLQAHAAVFSIWPAMTRAYDRIAEIVAARPWTDKLSMAALRESMQTHHSLLQRTFLATEEWRTSREEVYADMYLQCGRGLAGLSGAPGLGPLLAPAWTSMYREAEAMLQQVLRQRFGPPDATTEAFVRSLSACILEFLLRLQAALRVATAVQDQINRLLDRKLPKRAFRGADVDVYNLLQGDDPDRMPYLLDELERLFGITIELEAGSLSISERDMGVCS